MRTTRMVLALAVVFGLTSMAAAADVKKLIVGKWEAAKVDDGTLPKGAIADFTADGKLKIVAKKGDKEETVEGTYTVDGDSFTFKLSFNGKEVSQKIDVTKISETEMETTGSDKKNVTFKKVK